MFMIVSTVQYMEWKLMLWFSSLSLNWTRIAGSSFYDVSDGLQNHMLKNSTRLITRSICVLFTKCAQLMHNSEIVSVYWCVSLPKQTTQSRNPL